MNQTCLFSRIFTSLYKRKKRSMNLDYGYEYLTSCFTRITKHYLCLENKNYIHCSDFLKTFKRDVCKVKLLKSRYLKEDVIM